VVNTFSLPLLNSLNIAQSYEYRNARVAFQLHVPFAEEPSLLYFQLVGIGARTA